MLKARAARKCAVAYVIYFVVYLYSFNIGILERIVVDLDYKVAERRIFGNSDILVGTGTDAAERTYSLYLTRKEKPLTSLTSGRIFPGRIFYIGGIRVDSVRAVNGITAASVIPIVALRKRPPLGAGSAILNNAQTQASEQSSFAYRRHFIAETYAGHISAGEKRVFGNLRDRLGKRHTYQAVGT